MKYNEVIQSINSTQYLPVYFLQGDNAHYIDEITNLLIEKVLDESERDFNQTIFYGKDSSVDQIIDAAQDINYLVTLSSRDKEKDRLELARKILSTKHLPKWFQFLENFLEKNGESSFFVGKNISIADLAIWILLGWLTSGLLDGVPTNILEPYERLTKLREEIYNHPKVNEWMMKTYGKII